LAGGWIVVLGHLVLLTWAWGQSTILPEEREMIAYMVAPVSAIYLIGLVKWLSSYGDPIEFPEPASGSVLLTSLVLPGTLILMALYLVMSYPGPLADTSDWLQLWLGGIELAIGATVGLVVNDLVPHPG
jgi:hypothetical protein